MVVRTSARELGSMKEFLKKYTKKLWWIALIIEIIVIIVGLVFIEIYYGWLGLGIPVADKSEEVAVIIYRNRGFALAAIVGVILTATGMLLTAWGRRQTNEQIALSRAEIELSKKAIELSGEANASKREEADKQLHLNKVANANERYEKAARMLRDTVLAVRIAGCHALENLAIDDEKMIKQCVQLLSAFIVNPFDDKNGTDKNETKSFPEHRQDVRAAVDGLLAIDKYYKEKNVLDEVNLRGADLTKVNFRGVSLRGANLSEAHVLFADLTEADLTGADLSHANLTATNLIKTDLTKANLVKADLDDADLSGANLTGAKLTMSKNLRKEQVLSTKFYFGTRPYLFRDLLQDKEIQEWLAKYQQENEDL